MGVNLDSEAGSIELPTARKQPLPLICFLCFWPADKEVDLHEHELGRAQPKGDGRELHVLRPPHRAFRFTGM